LNIQPAGIYVDGTFGGGGHSQGMLEKLNAKGKLLAFDQDADAQKNIPDDERLIFIPQNFRHLQRFLRLHKIEQVDGVLVDLGVSSFQLNEGGRGFSTRFDGPLDMRMDQRQTLTAEKIVATYSEEQLHKIFEQYGEITNAKTLAKQIASNRSLAPIKTIQQFKALIHSVVKGNPHKYLAQVFQALRIETNDELGALKELLQCLPLVLKPNGRAVFITFHSLEDRIVKLFFKQGSFDEEIENPFINTIKAKVFELVNKKPITPTDEELKRNARSRSAKLRVAKKL
jgi:16S rRNA (cytosine1402-N4)-methyltransferase